MSDNDREWHHIVGSGSPDGTIWYIDGKRLTPDEARKRGLQHIGDKGRVTGRTKSPNGFGVRERGR